MFNTPYIAPVGSPARLVSGGKAWYARYRYEDPSTRIRGFSGISAIVCLYRDGGLRGKDAIPRDKRRILAGDLMRNAIKYSDLVDQIVDKFVNKRS